MITNEKRAFKRVKRNFHIRHKLHDGSGPAGMSISKNISLGGVYFISLQKLNIGELLDCRIDMPGVSGEGKWMARVVRCEDLDDNLTKTFGVAVEFVESFGDSEKKLKSALSE